MIIIYFKALHQGYEVFLLALAHTGFLQMTEVVSGKHLRSSFLDEELSYSFLQEPHGKYFVFWVMLVSMVSKVNSDN